MIVFAAATAYTTYLDPLLGLGWAAATVALGIMQWGDRIAAGKDYRPLGLATFPSIMGFVGLRWFYTDYFVASLVAFIGGISSTTVLGVYFVTHGTNPDSRGS